MTQEDKELLLKDLCARLPYGIKVLISGEKYFDEEKESYIEELVPGSYLFDSDVILKPYLRPMSSMTEEEVAEFESITETLLERGTSEEIWDTVVDWLNANHFDHRHLIEKGLALEAPEGMYNIN